MTDNDYAFNICSINFSTRVLNQLLNAGIITIDALLSLDSLDILMKRRGFGKASRTDIIDKMRRNGYTQWADKMDVNSDIVD